jgi:hypothetical protein
MDWKEIVSVSGSPQTGGAEFLFAVGIPMGGAESSAPATERQIVAIQKFYARDIPGLTKDQAHALLCYREYARLCCEAMVPKYPDKLKRSLSICLAVFISNDKEISDFVIRWNESVYQRGSSQPRVKGSLFYLDIKNFGEYIIEQLAECGFTAQYFQ